MKPQSSKMNKKYEGGYIIPAGTALLIFSIALMGLVVDGARVYVTKLRLQRAVDAGAVAGGRLILSNDPTTDHTMPLDVAKAIADRNLTYMNFFRGPIASEPSRVRLKLETTWRDAKRTELQVYGEYTLPNVFLGMLPFFPDYSMVNAKSVAVTRRSVICLALDYSQSMDDPLSDGTKKIDALKVATQNFLNLFEEKLDYIGYVYFNGKAQDQNPHPIVSDFLKYRDNFDPTIPTISLPDDPYSGPDMVLSPGTNQEDGLKKCRDEMLKVPEPILASSTLSVILVTDGAPTRSCDPNDDYLSVNCNMRKYASDDEKELLMDRAIRIADDIRIRDNLGINVHTIGIGRFGGTEIMKNNMNQPYSGPAISGQELENQSAYQGTKIDVYDMVLKSNFLRRVANFPPKNNVEPIEYFRGESGYQTLNFQDYNAANPGVSQGIYLSTNDSKDLSTLLADIGTSIKGRLVE